MNRKELYRFSVKHGKKSYPIVILKPNLEDTESASFFYGQKYNEYIRKGFLTRAMMSKQYGEIGTEEDLQNIHKALLSYYEAEKVISLFDVEEDKLSEDQKKRVAEAKMKFVEVQKILQDHQMNIRAQLSQTADTLAEEKLMQWFIFFHSFYEEKFEDKTQQFPLFSGSNFDEKFSSYLKFADEDFEPENTEDKKLKDLLEKSFATTAKVISFWYNNRKISQKEIKDLLKESE